MINNKQDALESLNKNQVLIGKISEELRGDGDVILAAVAKHWWAIGFASDELKTDTAFFLQAMKVNPGVKQFLDSYTDKQFLWSIIEADGSALDFVGESLKSSKEFLLGAIVKNPSTLKYVSEELQNDTELLLGAISENDKVLKQITSGVKRDLFQSYLGAENQLKLFLKSSELNHEIKDQTEKLLTQVRSLFVTDLYSCKSIIQVLNDTHSLLTNKMTYQDYQIKANEVKVMGQVINVAPSIGWSILGGIMIALGAIVAGLSIAMLATGCGVIPGVIAGVTAATLFAPGIAFFNKGIKEGKSTQANDITSPSGWTKLSNEMESLNGAFQPNQ